MTAAIIVEARMGSTRLPGKHMRPLSGRPMIARLLERLKRSRAATICLATTTRTEDDLLEAWAREAGVSCHRGAVNDVLGRVLGAARHCGVDVIAEITGDCPLADPALIDQAIHRHAKGDADY
ncbi:MAG: NTP transferase domain-containing protein, partial [Alphaproteobacteria bacterium]